MTEPLKLRTKFWYGFGQMAEGVKAATFEVFLFFYYTQVLGLSGTLCGLALMITVFTDAVTDPVMGSVSDAHRSRWGRRHPFMYASAFPLGITMFLLFFPPAGLGEWGLFAWLLSLAVCAHVFLTAYHLPHMALGADLSSDYTERTRIVAFRSMFQLVAGGAVVPLSFYFIFQPSETFENGQLNPDAYPILAAAVSFVIVVAILGTSLGTHSRIPFLVGKELKRAEPFGLKRLATEYGGVLRNRSYLAFFSASLVLLVGLSISGVLGVHMLTYFWRLEPTQIGHWGTAMLLGSLIGVPFWASIAPFLEKKTLYLLGLCTSGLGLGVAPLLLILGYFPAHGTLAFLVIVLASGFFARAGFAASFVVGGSMVADLADEMELSSGRRLEGVLFSGLSFSTKVARAGALQIAGLALDLIGFPVGADPHSIDSKDADSLGFLYATSILLSSFAAALVISRYRMTKTRLMAVQKEIRKGGRNGD